MNILLTCLLSKRGPQAPLVHTAKKRKLVWLVVCVLITCLTAAINQLFSRGLFNDAFSIETIQRRMAEG
jgi:Mg/Co/Ni transporter MgtE